MAGETHEYAGINQLLGSLLNGSALGKIEQLDPQTRDLISSLQQHNAQLTNLLSSQTVQHQTAQHTLSYGEKHRLLEHIAQLEGIHHEVSISLNRINVENQILRKLRYAHL